MTVPSLKTRRLVLRPLIRDDAVLFSKYASDPDIACMTGSFPLPYPVYSVEGLIDIFAAQAVTGQAYHWAITLDGNFIGALGVTRTDQGWSFGYWIAKPFWNQGYSSEAVEAVISHMAAVDPTATLLACVFTDNPASRRLLEKFGFSNTGAVAPSYSVARDAKFPVHHYCLDLAGVAGAHGQKEAAE